MPFLRFFRPDRLPGRVCRSSALPLKADLTANVGKVCVVPILLQKSEIEVRRIVRENTKQEAIADSCTLARLTEVAGEYNERR